MLGVTHWPPHRPRPTPPRFATTLRMRRQGQIGWPATSKIVLMKECYFMHPTKGHRVCSPGRFERVKKKHILPKPRKRIKTELQKLVGGMSNWQRTQYSQATGALRREGKNPDFEALARSYSELERRAP